MQWRLLFHEVTRCKHLAFMDNLKKLGKKRRGIGNAYGNCQIFSQDVGMEFGAEKCVMLLINKWVGEVFLEKKKTEEFNYPIWTLSREKSHKYLDIFGRK